MNMSEKEKEAVRKDLRAQIDKLQPKLDSSNAAIVIAVKDQINELERRLIALL